jgi:hypothetical protein
MKIYLSRIFWYLAITLIFFGMMKLPQNSALGPLFAAGFIYAPLSLVWIPISNLMYRHYGMRERAFGLEINTILSCGFFIGFLLCVGFAVFHDANILELGILLIFASVDGIISQREGRMIVSGKTGPKTI